MFGGEGGEWRPPVRQIGSLAELTALPTAAVKQIAAVVIEPLVQGAAGMKLWPKGTLAALRAWTKGRGILLIVDEVLTGFGRTGTMFACDQESVFPDLMVLGKGLSGGYLPIALTLLSEEVFEPFSAGSSRERTFFYGHSYTGNSLACAAALASLELFSREPVLELLETKIAFLQAQAVKLRQMPWIQDVRQCGFILAIELSTPRPASIDACALAQAVCLEARRHGLLTRPIRNNIILMPPFCITKEQLRQSVTALRAAILRVCENRPEAAFV
jgi:adenosylmethionine-8-amino-7-oxononanoate aminotransferase